MNCRKSLMAVFFFLTLTSLLGAQDLFSIKSDDSRKWNISATTSIGLMNGEVNELVFPNFTTDNPYLSRLVWQLENIPILSINLGFRFSRFQFALNGGFALSERSGDMNDYDWLYSNLSDWTHWSNHQIFFNGTFLGDLNARYMVLDSKGWSLSAGAGCKFRYWDWRDEAESFTHTIGIPGDNTYEAGDPFRNFSSNFGGIPRISYRVFYAIPYLLVSTGYRFSVLEFALQASYSPGVVADAWDHHYDGGIYNDVGYWGQFLGIALEIKVKPYRGWVLSLISNIDYLFTMKGKTGVYTEDMVYLGQSSAKSGFQFLNWYIGLNLGYLF